jgi:hypothetical protein
MDPWYNNALTAAVNSNVWKQIKADWSLNFNQIDFELGRKFYVGKWTTLRPYAAVRGGWTKTNFNVHNVNSHSAPIEYVPTALVTPILETQTDIENSSRSKNTYWGAGLVAGLQPTWMFSKMFSLYANVDAALLWGKFKGSRKVRSTYTSCDFNPPTAGTCTPFSNDTGYINATEELYQMVTIIDLALGLRWEMNWSCDRYRTALDIGWEHHTWFNHGIRHRTSAPDREDSSFLGDTNNGAFAGDVWSFNANTIDVISDLTLGGLVMRFSFDF